MTREEYGRAVILGTFKALSPKPLLPPEPPKEEKPEPVFNPFYYLGGWTGP